MQEECLVEVIRPGSVRGELFKLALDLAQAGAMVPLNDDEQKLIKKIARKADPLLPLHK